MPVLTALHAHHSQKGLVLHVAIIVGQHLVAAEWWLLMVACSGNACECVRTAYCLLLAPLLPQEVLFT
jgi:hypothetical protein